MRGGIWGAVGLIITIVITVVSSSVSYALDAQSTNYRLNESAIGSGSTVQSSSTNFKASDAVGDIAIGGSASTNFQVNSGNKTPSDPNLAVSVNTGSIAFPTFSASTPSLTTASFSVLNYTSFGYVVQIAGTVPTHGAKTIAGMATTGPSVAGTEQFGINLVANTAPISVGANPNNYAYGFGSASPNYSTPNSYRYVNGETIALASKSSGLTDYTITFLVNVAGLTPGGGYTSNQTIIVTGTY